MVNVPYEEQLRRKQEDVETCIGTFGPVAPILRMKNPDHYRNKVTAVFAKDYSGRGMGSFQGYRQDRGSGRAAGRKNGGGQIICGIYEKGTHRVVPVERCLLENVRADAIVQSVRSLMPSFRIEPYDEDLGTGILRYVQVRTAHSTHQIMVTLVTAGPILPSRNNFTEALRRLHPEITTIVQNINDRTDSMILGERDRALYGPGYIEDRLCGKLFRISPHAFYQVNSLQTEKLYNIAIDFAGLSGKETVLDAYCGIGTIGICASDRARELIGVELNAEAIRDAQVNAQRNGLTESGDRTGAESFAGSGTSEDSAAEKRAKTRPAARARFYQMDATEFMQEMAAEGQKVDVLFMDPPRAGAAEEFVDAASRIAPEKIVYISCNPETLGRDLARFCQRGYRLQKAQPVDMFPATGWVETVCLLSKRRPDTTID